MSRFLCSGCLCASIALGTTPSAADASGVSLGARTGWAFPIGSLEQGDPLASNFDGMLPIWLDIGYRLREQLYVGAYWQWARAFVASEVCPSPLDCSAVDLRIGVALHWHFKSHIDRGAWLPGFDPWVGFGAGYESAIIDLATDRARSHQTNHGFEFANVQLGGDYVGAAPFRWGGFAGLTFGQYAFRTHSVPTQSTDHTIAGQALHLWLFVGVRGRYDI